MPARNEAIVTARIPLAERDAIVEVALEDRCSNSSVIRRAVAQFLATRK